MSEETSDGQPSEAEPSTATVGWLPWSAETLFGPGATAQEAYGLLTVDVPAERWLTALTCVRDELGGTFFDWLSAVDEGEAGFRICVHLAALPEAPGGTVRTLLVRTTVPREAPSLPSATGVWAGAAWHERETHEMFGVDFPDHPGLTTLLLPDGFEGHPLRKDFVLAARVVKQWPGAKEPGESGHGGPKRRQMLPPGVPDPNEWGPQKGQLPPVPGRPTRSRGAGASRGEGAGERRPRRTRSADAGSASQRPASGSGSGEATGPDAAAGSGATSAEGSAAEDPKSAGGAGSSASGATSTTPASGGPAARGPRRNRSATGGSASQRAAGEERAAPGATAEGAATDHSTAADETDVAPPADAAAPPEPGASPEPSGPSKAADADAPPAEGAAEPSGTARHTPRAARSTDAPWHQHAPDGTTEADAQPPHTDAESTPDAPATPESAAPEPEEPDTPSERAAPEDAPPEDVRDDDQPRPERGSED